MYGQSTDGQRLLTDQQWQLFTRTIEDETESSRLAHKLIPRIPLPSSARAVAADILDYATGRVDDETQFALKERQQQLLLTRQQVEDPEAASAVVVLRRAAQLLARDHDRQVFQVTIRDPIDEANPPGGVPDEADNFNPIQPVARNGGSGEGMIPAVAGAITTLDSHGYRTGFVLVAGLELYKRLHRRPAGAADLPIVAVQGLLEGGPVHRSTVLEPNEALLLSVVGIDRAVAVEPIAEFLRVEESRDRAAEPAAAQEFSRWRVYERYLGRFRERRSAVLLRLQADDGDR